MFRSLLSGLFTLRGLLVILGLVGLAFLIWLAGPFLAIGDFAPLRSEQNRIALIVGVLALLIAVGVIRHWLAWRANRKMIAALLDNETLSALADNRGVEEAELVQSRYEAAMRVLQETMASGDGARNYLTQLPWYVIIGPPGAGKTTILKNSGLEFPLAQKLGDDPIAGIGGTRNCDWWFTDKGVLIDTAGRYTTQDVNAESDRAAWRAFLNVLKTHRPRRPINGVLLAISLADVLRRNTTERKRLVDAMRRRLQELMKTFGMPIPVYLLITKADLIAGFTEYFDQLDEDGRRQVWGVTFRLEGSAETVADEFSEGCQQLADTLEQGLVARMHAETSLPRRVAMFGFPKEFAALRQTISEFVGEVFKPNKYELAAWPRGVYFTSGTQEGAPIDRLFGALTRNLGLSEIVRPPFAGQGKAFFIHDMLMDVAFEEAGLIGVDRRLERRIAAIHAFGYVAAAILVCGGLLLWFGALSRSEARIAETEATARAVKAKLAEVPDAAPFAKLSSALDAARSLKSASGQDDLFAWLDGLGLSATPTLAPEAQEAYDRVLLTRLLPSYLDRVAARLRAAESVVGGSDPNAMRDALRLYLMFQDPAHFDRAIVSQSAHAEAALAFPVDPARKASLTADLDRLVELLPRPVDQLPRVVQIDKPLVAVARTGLLRQPRVEQVYSALLQEADRNPRLRAIDLVQVVGTTGLQVADSRDSKHGRPIVPGIFTKSGFYDFVLPRLPSLVREQEGADWIVALDQANDVASQQLTQQVLNRYIQDYIATWQTALSTVTALRFSELARADSVLQSLADPQSPLIRLVDVVKTNTSLPPPGEDDKADAAKPAQTASPLPTLVGLADKAAGAIATPALGDMPWPGKTIGAPFVPLANFASANGATPAPVDKVRDDLGKLFNAVSGLANAPDPSQAAFQLVEERVKDPSTDVFSALRADSATAPSPVREIVQDVARSSWAILLKMSYDYSNTAWQRDVLPFCVTALDDRFPLFPKSKDDVTLRDFGDFFHPGGVIDGFFTKYLAPLVVDQRIGYAPAKIDGVALPLSVNALRQFQLARVIRNAFFVGAGATPAVKFSLQPVFLHPDVLRATVRNDAQEVVYRHEPPRAFDLDWPTKSDASNVSVTLTLLDGTEQRYESSGPWAFLRLIGTAQTVTRGSADRFTLTIGDPQGVRVSYELRAGSTQNPFNLGALTAFRCPDAL